MWDWPLGAIGSRTFNTQVGKRAKQRASPARSGRSSSSIRWGVQVRQPRPQPSNRVAHPVQNGHLLPGCFLGGESVGLVQAVAVQVGECPLDLHCRTALTGDGG